MKFKLQSAMEYLMTYGWAILIAAVVIGIFFALGVFNPGASAGQQCTLPAGFVCSNFYINYNGLLTINLLQITTTPINITGIGCNTNVTFNNFDVYATPNQLYMQVGINKTMSVQCYSGGIATSLTPGTQYKGYVLINYTETTTGLPHTAFGRLFVKGTG